MTHEHGTQSRFLCVAPLVQHYGIRVAAPNVIDELGGFLHLLPMHISQPLTVSSIHASALPWGSPGLYALSGHPPDDPATAVLELAYEWPTRWLRSAEPVAQQDLEWLHVQRFRSDFVLATGQLPFVNVRPGNDPPDVLVDTTEGTVGVECTRLALQDRLAAHGLFQAVRQRIGQVPPEHFAALHGHVVYLWFNDADSALSRPFRASDEAAAVDLVRALASYRPNTGNLWITGKALPDPAPTLPMQSTPAGARFYALPFVNAVPDTVLSNYAGFELGLAFTTRHEAVAEWGSLTERIVEKDKPGSDWLLISAGAPDNRGFAHPGEEAVATLLLKAQSATSLNLQYLRRVTVHVWSTGEAFDIWPQQIPLFGPLYQGAAPAHRPFPAASGGEHSG
jgi:hypothetical protein